MGLSCQCCDSSWRVLVSTVLCGCVMYLSVVSCFSPISNYSILISKFVFLEVLNPIDQDVSLADHLLSTVCWTFMPASHKVAKTTQLVSSLLPAFRYYVAYSQIAVLSLSEVWLISCCMQWDSMSIIHSLKKLHSRLIFLQYICNPTRYTIFDD